MTSTVSEHRYTSDDGLSLYYRDYGSKDSRDTVLCLPGLTRNSRDFHELANLLCQTTQPGQAGIED